MSTTVEFSECGFIVSHLVLAVVKEFFYGTWEEGSEG